MSSRMLASRLLILSLPLASFPQVSQDISRVDCGPPTEPGGIVRGRLVNDSTGEPVSGRAVLLGGANVEWCTALTDSAGRYAFLHVPAGQYELHVGDLGYRRVRPITVTISPDTAISIVVALRAEDWVADCLEVAHCAELLRVEQPPGRYVLSESEKLREAVFRTSIALAFGQSDSLPSWIPCVDDSSAMVIEQLRTRIPTAAHASQCEMEKGEDLLYGRLRDRLTGRPARRFYIERSTIFPGDSATVHSAYYAGPTHGIGWRCRYVREPGSWRAIWCGFTWIS